MSKADEKYFAKQNRDVHMRTGSKEAREKSEKHRSNYHKLGGKLKLW
jgi:hypothetical protein